jgi:hypothetical protein
MIQIWRKCDGIFFASLIFAGIWTIASFTTSRAHQLMKVSWTLQFMSRIGLFKGFKSNFIENFLLIYSSFN